MRCIACGRLIHVDTRVIEVNKVYYNTQGNKSVSNTQPEYVHFTCVALDPIPIGRKQ